MSAVLYNPKKSVDSRSFLERLSANPFQTVKMAAREMGMAFTTVQRAMEKLEAQMEILEEPAKLAPGILLGQDNGRGRIRRYAS